MSEATQNTNSSSSPTNPKMSPGLAKAIAEGTLKFPEGQPEPTFFHCAVDDCGYKSYGEIAQKYHAKEVHDLAKPKFVEKLLNTCTRCTKTFSESGSLNRHTNSVHSNFN